MARKFGDVVVLLPGLIGSVLEKDGRVLWGTSPGAIWGTVAGNNLKQLTLTAEDNGDEDLGDGIVATALVPNTEIIPGLWKQGGYSRLADDLVGALHLERGQNFFEFAYDWRRDNRVSATKLAKQAHSWLSAWREASGNDDAKLILVAHSMGGLVARYFIECLEGWKSVRMLVSFGTPYRGSGNALDFLCKGFTWKVGGVSLFDGSDALRSFDSVHQLQPVYPVVDDRAGSMKRVKDLALPNLLGSRVSKAAAFHEEITRAHEANAAVGMYAGSSPTIRPIVGISQPTWQSAEFKDGKVTSLRSYEGEDDGGDGTVPRVAAIPLEDDHGSTASYFATSHSALQSVRAALENLHGIISGKTIDLRKFRSRKAAEGIGLYIDDVYSSAEPICIDAVPPEYRQILTGSIERLDAVAEVEAVTLQQVDGLYRVEAILPPGLYRVAVQGKALPQVENVFLVLDPSLTS